MITVNINGNAYTNIKEYEVTRSVEDVAGAFHIVVATPFAFSPPFQNGDPITLFINGIPVLTGHLETRHITYDQGSHEITITGRDNVADLVDSTIGNKLEFKAPVSLPQIIGKVIQDIQLTKCKVINKVGNLDSFTEDEIASGAIDETIFDFLEKYTKKRQVLMSTDGRGNLVLQRAGKVRAATALTHVVGDDDDQYNDNNNVLRSDINYDDSKRFYHYRVHSQGNPAATKPGSTKAAIFPRPGQSVVDFLDSLKNKNKKGKSKKTITDRYAEAYDTEVRHTRVLDITAESSTDTSTLKKRAVWEATVRRARSISYSCTVQGHTMTPNGKPWEPNLLVQVVDDFALITSDLLIKEVKYSYALSGGSVTELELVHPDSYLPEPEVKTKGKIGHKKKGRKKSASQLEKDNFYREVSRQLNQDHLKSPQGGLIKGGP